MNTFETLKSRIETGNREEAEEALHTAIETYKSDDLIAEQHYDVLVSIYNNLHGEKPETD